MLHVMLTLPLDIGGQKVGDDLISSSRVEVKVEVVARVRVQVRRELRSTTPDGASRILEYALALAVANDVVRLSGNGLSDG